MFQFIYFIQIYRVKDIFCRKYIKDNTRQNIFQTSMNRGSRGKRLLESTHSEEFMLETKRLCSEVDRMNAKLTSLESKMDNKYQTIIDNQNKLLEYLTKIETSLASVSASLTSH